MKQTPTYEAHKPSKFLTGTALFTILVAIFLIVFGAITYLQNQDTKSKLDQQAEETNRLSKEIKELAEENKENSQKAANYAYCNAYLFAKYTQDGQPIVIEDLNTCVTTVFPTGEGGPTIPTEDFQKAQGNVQGSTVSPSAGSTGSKSTSGGSTGSTGGQTGTNPQTTPQSPQQPSGIVLDPKQTLPVLEIVPDVKIPGILEIR